MDNSYRSLRKEIDSPFSDSHDLEMKISDKVLSHPSHSLLCNERFFDDTGNFDQI